jgi:hypothetical protein
MCPFISLLSVFCIFCAATSDGANAQPANSPEPGRSETPSAEPKPDAAAQAAKKTQDYYWKAWLEPKGQEFVLNVHGIVEGATPGHHAVAARATPQGINPRILILDVTQNQLPGVWPNVTTAIPCCFIDTVRPDQFTQVTIRQAGGRGRTVDIIPPNRR